MKLTLSRSATTLLWFHGKTFLRDSKGNPKAWFFTPAEDAEEAKKELVHWKLIQPVANWYGPHIFTEAGHLFLLQNQKRLEAHVNDEEHFFPDTFVISGIERKGQRDVRKGVVIIPCAEELPVALGSTIEQKDAAGPIVLKVTEKEFDRGAGAEVSSFPHLLTLHVRNLSAEEHQAPKASSISIGSISGTGIQVGNYNQQSVNMFVQEFVQEVVKTKDPEAKGLLLKILETKAASAVLGAGAQALIAMVTGIPPGNS